MFPSVVTVKKVGLKFVVRIFDGSTTEFDTEEDAAEAASTFLHTLFANSNLPKVGLIDFEEG